MKNFWKFVLAVCVLAMAVCASESFADDWKSYADKKFGYSLDYPDIFEEYEDPYTDGDGLSVFSGSAGDGKYAFEISGGKKSKGADGDKLLKEATNMEEDEYGYIYGVEPMEETAKSGVDFYTLEYIDDSAGPDEITHVYCAVGKTIVVKYWIRYPKEDAEQYAEITARMNESLKAK
jgi:hypothetical protein